MEAQQMATTKLSDEEFLAFLEKHPDLRDRFASIVSAVENYFGRVRLLEISSAKISRAHAKGSTTPVYAGARRRNRWTPSFSNARFGPASARIPEFMRSGTERHGSWAKWRSSLAPMAAA
jgi:hypothetical protein